jgi:Gpi18-like mannosyltransferase
LRASVLLALKLHRDLVAVVLSILVQVPLAVFLGHYYDERSFIDTGYLVSSGLNPYIPHVISVFSNPSLMGVNPIIGYPPLWPLLLGAIYRFSYNFVPNIFLYNFAIKIPVVASNIALAYVTKTILQNLNVTPKRVQFAWLFLLFNPFTLLTTTAWGEFDTLIALLCVVSFYLLTKGEIIKSSILLSLSVVLKPISLPLIGLPLFFSTPNNRQKKLIYIAILCGMIIGLWFLPFNLLGWMVPSSPGQVTAYFKMADSMTLFNLVELIQNTAVLPAGLEFLGYVWMPALLIGYYFVYRKPPKTMPELAEKAVILLLIFFLTRTWLSEPNLNLIISLALLTIIAEETNFYNFAFLWVIPLVFMFFNTSVPQLFFLVSPSVVPNLAQLDQTIRFWRLIGKFIIVVVWQVFAWRLVVKILTRKPKNIVKSIS